MTILVTHGARKNVGDFLIHERGLALLSRVLPGERFVSVPRWDPLDPAQLFEASGLVLCGGPGLATDFFPGVFPLLKQAESRRLPVLLLAQGWSGRPRSGPEHFRFSNESREMLHRLADLGAVVTTRDVLSQEVVQTAGLNEATMTGCVVWYSQRHLGQKADKGPVRRLVFTTPAWLSNAPMAIRLMRDVARRFPAAEKWCVFHRGFGVGRGMKFKESAATSAMAAAARLHGYRLVDASSNLRRIDFYETCDLHVGYRVHAHLAFLSTRRRSVLINEDGRGAGQARSLGEFSPLDAEAPGLEQMVLERVDVEAATGSASDAAIAVIDETWPVMERAVASWGVRVGAS